MRRVCGSGYRSFAASVRLRGDDGWNRGSRSGPDALTPWLLNTEQSRPFRRSSICSSPRSNSLCMSGTEPPVVVLLEDLQWADSASLSLVVCFTATRFTCRCSSVGTYQADEVARSRSSPTCAIADLTQKALTIPLAGLDNDGDLRQLRDNLGLATSTAEAEHLRRLTGGNLGRKGHGRASRIRFSGVSAARRKLLKPASSKTSRSRASPAWAPRPEADLLGERVGRADRRRRGVEQRRPSDCRRCCRAVVEGERLDEQDRAVLGEVLAGVAGDADRVAHVVQAVEEADQVEGAGVALGSRRPRRWRGRRRRPPARRRAVSIDGGMEVEAR